MIKNNLSLYALIMGLSLPCVSYAADNTPPPTSHKDNNASSHNDASKNGDNAVKIKAEDFLSTSDERVEKIQKHLKSLDGSISFCSGQMEASDRLTCFENVARDEGVYIEPVSFKKKKEESDEYQWSKKVTTDISKQTVIFTGVETANVVDSLNPTDKNPPHAYLNVRCKKGDYDLYVSYDKELINKIKNGAGQEVYPTKPFTVNLNIGGEQKDYPFTSGSSGHSIGLWGSDNAEALVRYINNYGSNNSDDKQKITATIDLGDNHYITSTFSIINMYNSLQDVLNVCHK